MTRTSANQEAKRLAREVLSEFHLGEADVDALASAVYAGNKNAVHWAFKRKPGNRKWCPCGRGECKAIRDLAKILPPEVRPLLQAYGKRV